MAKLGAVILDLDGTLVDSERYGHRVAFNMVFERRGLPDRWEEDYYGELLKITGGKERLRRHLRERGVSEDELEDLVPELHAKKNEAFLELVDQGRIPPRPGAARLLDELEEREVRMAIATTGSREWVDPLIEKLFGRDRFEEIVAGGDVPDKKPDPAVFEILLERLGLGPSETLAVEDSSNGLRAAKAAGLPCLIVVNDYTQDEDFEAADLVLDGFGEEQRPAKVLYNPLSVEFDGLVRTEVLLEVHARATDR